MSDHRTNRRALRVAAARYMNNQSDDRFTALESAFEQVKFDRMEVETEPQTTEEPELKDDGA